MKGKRKIDRERDIDGTKKEEGRDSYCKDVEFGVEMCFFLELGSGHDRIRGVTFVYPCFFLPNVRSCHNFFPIFIN